MERIYIFGSLIVIRRLSFFFDRNMAALVLTTIVLNWLVYR